MIQDFSDTVASGSLLLAIPIAALAGLVSFFSPCVIPLLPGYLSYVTGIAAQDLDHGHRGRMVLGSTLFVLGFTAVFVAGGSLFGALGGQLLEHRPHHAAWRTPRGREVDHHRLVGLEHGSSELIICDLLHAPSLAGPARRANSDR